MVIFVPPIIASPTVYRIAPNAAVFDYDIALPDGSTRAGAIEARIPATERQPFAGGFDDAVRAALEIQKFFGPLVDGTHPQPINQVLGIQTDAAGQLYLGRMTGFHRDRLGPLFVDGQFFDDNARKVTVTSTGQASDGLRLIGVVGMDRVLDLRTSPTATVVNPRTPNPTPPRG